jgi:hypothetical protein
MRQHDHVLQASAARAAALHHPSPVCVGRLRSDTRACAVAACAAACSCRRRRKRGSSPRCRHAPLSRTTRQPRVHCCVRCDVAVQELEYVRHELRKKHEDRDEARTLLRCPSCPLHRRAPRRICVGCWVSSCASADAAVGLVCTVVATHGRCNAPSSSRTTRSSCCTRRLAPPPCAAGYPRGTAYSEYSQQARAAPSRSAAVRLDHSWPQGKAAAEDGERLRATIKQA